MIEVKIDLVPLGLEVLGRENIKTLIIVNKRQLESDKGQLREYHVWYAENKNQSSRPDAIVKHFREDGALVLIEKALKILNKGAHQ